MVYWMDGYKCALGFILVVLVNKVAPARSSSDRSRWDTLVKSSCWVKHEPLQDPLFTALLVKLQGDLSADMTQRPAPSAEGNVPQTSHA